MKKLIIVLALVVLLIIPVACKGSVEVYFPMQSNSSLDQMDAELEGNLELVDSWLRLQSADGDYVLVWPDGFSVRGEDKEIQVLDSLGQVVAVVGEALTVGGGESTRETVESYIGIPLPADAEGPYWIVSEVISD